MALRAVADEGEGVVLEEFLRRGERARLAGQKYEQIGPKRAQNEATYKELLLGPIGTLCSKEIMSIEILFYFSSLGNHKGRRGSRFRLQWLGALLRWPERAQQTTRKQDLTTNLKTKKGLTHHRRPPWSQQSQSS